MLDFKWAKTRSSGLSNIRRQYLNRVTLGAALSPTLLLAKSPSERVKLSEGLLAPVPGG